VKTIDRYDTQILSSLLRCKSESTISLELLAALTGIDDLDHLNSTIDTLVTNGIITMHSNQINLMPQSRLKLTFLLIKEGFEIEHVAKYLDWGEFEAFTKDILRLHEFQVHSRVRFKSNAKKKRYECDLVAIRNSIVLCIDCKHWSSRSGKKYGLKKAVEKQVERTLVLSEKFFELDFEKFGIEKRDDLLMMPLLISWLVEDIRVYQDVPIVPIFQLSNFINQIDAIIDNFKIISIKK